MRCLAHVVYRFVETRRFLSAIEYGLRCIGRQNFVLNFVLKPQQLETVWLVCHGTDMFFGSQKRSGKTLCYEVLPFVID